MSTSRITKPFSSRWVGALAAAGVMLATAACRKDNNANPNPSPSPSPSPTATPVTNSTSSADSSTSTRNSKHSSSPELNVARGHADIIRAEVLDAIGGVRLLENIFNAQSATQDANFSDAARILDSTYRAFLQSEAALFYYPDVQPAWSLPLGNFNAKSPSPATPGFAALGQALAAYPSIPPDKFGFEPVRAPALDSLRSQAAALRSSLEQFAADWDPDLPDNFRSQSFVSDPSAAVGKIFEGLLSVTDELILDQSAPVDPVRLVGRLEGIRATYTGRYETLQFTTVWSDGLQTLLQNSDPAAAGKLGALIDSLLDSWRNDGAYQGEKSTLTLQEIKKQITAAAESLGYPVEPQTAAQP